MDAFNVAYRVSENIFSCNIAQGPSAEAVRLWYEAKGHEVVTISPASPCEVKAAQRKGMPLVVCR